MIRSATQKNQPYLLSEVRLRMLASVTTGNCRSGVRDLWGEGLCVTVREKGWFGSSKELRLTAASSLAGSEPPGLAAEGAVDVIQSELIWCAWVCWNCCVRLCCVCESVCAGRRGLRSWCLGGVWSSSSCSRPPSLCSGILNWRSYVWGRKRNKDWLLHTNCNHKTAGIGQENHIIMIMQWYNYDYSISCLHNISLSSQR